MDKNTAYRVASALTTCNRGIWVPVPSDYWDEDKPPGDWCIMNALHPEAVFEPTVDMWADVKAIQARTTNTNHPFRTN